MSCRETLKEYRVKHTGRRRETSSILPKRGILLPEEENCVENLVRRFCNDYCSQSWENAFTRIYGLV